MVERAAWTILAIECKLKEHPTTGDAAGLRALATTEKGRLQERLIVCRTKVPYKLDDGTWVVNPTTLLKEFLG